MSGVIISHHPCRPHQFQDSVYGYMNRVCNKSGKKGNNKARCTVCLLDVSYDPPKTNDKKNKE